MTENQTAQRTSMIEPLRQQLNRVLVGKEDVIEMVLACLISKGHLLFDDLPGLGKTTLAKALAQSVGGHFARVQCTPDLLPTDITGFNIYNQENHSFEFKQGPVFSDLLLADEINRATPRTQSALFEAMAERQVTIDNQTMPLSTSFIVIATQNPVESHGAYPLPEAQLDRFAMKLTIGYPSVDDEVAMLGTYVGDELPNKNIEPILTLDELAQIQVDVLNVQVCQAVRKYIVDLGTATRRHSKVELGLSPRGLITWQRVAQGWAYLNGRDFVVHDDIQAVGTPVLNLRVSNLGSEPQSTIAEIFDSVPVPTER